MHIKRARYLANYLNARALMRLRAGHDECITAQDVIVADRRFREKKAGVPFDADSRLKVSATVIESSPALTKALKTIMSPDFPNGPSTDHDS